MFESIDLMARDHASAQQIVVRHPYIFFLMGGWADQPWLLVFQPEETKIVKEYIIIIKFTQEYV